MKKTNKKFAAGAVVTSALLVGSIAFAAWTVSGTGEGQAKAGRAIPVEIQSVTATDELYPTGDSDVEVKVKNPNPFKVKVTEIVKNGDIKVTSNNEGCSNSNHGVTFNDSTQRSDIIPAKTDTPVSLIVPKALSMSNASPDGCREATFTVPVEVKAESAPAGA